MQGWTGAPRTEARPYSEDVHPQGGRRCFHSDLHVQPDRWICALLPQWQEDTASLQACTAASHKDSNAWNVVVLGVVLLLWISEKPGSNHGGENNTFNTPGKSDRRVAKITHWLFSQFIPSTRHYKVVKLRKMRHTWERHVLKILVQKSEEGDHLEHICADSIKVKQIIKKYYIRGWSGFNWLKIGMGGRLFVNMGMCHWVS
jgi:hypothetical protein